MHDNKCDNCLNESNRLIYRFNGDQFCPKCNEEICEHLRTKTDPVGNGWETVTYCLDCKELLADEQIKFNCEAYRPRWKYF